MTKATAVAILGIILCAAIPALAAKPIRVMLLDGEQGGPYHAWQETSPYLRKMLDETGLFQVDVVTAPPAGGDSEGGSGENLVLVKRTVSGGTFTARPLLYSAGASPPDRGGCSVAQISRGGTHRGISARIRYVQASHWTHIRLDAQKRAGHGGLRPGNAALIGGRADRVVPRIDGG